MKNSKEFHKEIKRQIAFNLQNNNQPSMDCYYEFYVEGILIRWGFMEEYGYNTIVVFENNHHLCNIPREELDNYNWSIN